MWGICETTVQYVVYSREQETTHIAAAILKTILADYKKNPWTMINKFAATEIESTFAPLLDYYYYSLLKKFTPSKVHQVLIWTV